MARSSTAELRQPPPGTGSQLYFSGLVVATFLVFLSPTLVKSQTSQVIIVGSEIDFPPYAKVDANGHASGFSVDLLGAVAEVMGLRVEIHADPWSKVLAEFKAGKLDLLPLVALSPQRAEMATYTKPHTLAYDSFFVRRGSLPISTLADAKNKEVIVMTSDAAHEALVSSGIPVCVVETKTIPEAMRVLASGSHDAVLVPKLLGHMVLKDLKLESVIESGPPIPDYTRQFAFAVQRENTDLRDKLDQGIAIVRATGNYDEIYKKWFGGIELHDGIPWRIVVIGTAGAGMLVLFTAGWLLSFWRQTQLRRSEARYRHLFDSMTEMFQVIELVYDESGKVTDYYYRQVNPALEQLMNKTKDQLVGKRAKELFGVVEDHWLRAYEDVAKTGHPRRIMDYGAALDKYYDVHIWKANAREVAAAFTDITEIKRSEELQTKLISELREASSRLDMAQTASKSGVWDWNIETNDIKWSPQLFDLFGLDSKTTKPSFAAWKRVLHPEGVVVAGLRIETAVKDHTPLNNDYRIVLPDGQIRWINSVGEAQCDSQGKPVKMTGICIDITERKKAERAVRENSDILSKSQELANLGSWELDLLSNRLTWSDEVYRIFGLQPQEVAATYESFLSAIHPDDRPSVDAIYRNSLETGCNDYQIEHRVIRPKTGEIRIVHEKCNHIRNRDGRVIRSVGMVQDITERKKAEDRAVLLNAQMNDVLESISDAFFSVDDKFVVTFYNTAAEHALGRKRKEVIGKKLFDAFPEARGSIFEENYSRAMREKTGITFETFFGIIPFDNWYEVRVYPFANGISVYFQIITERKRAEEVLQLTSKELKTKNAEIERFLYTASHDLKSPVVTIQSFVRCLENDIAAAASGRIADDLKFINSAADKMAHLLNDLLEMSRVGTVISHSVHATAKDMVADAVNTVSGRISDHGVAVKVEDMDVALYCDRPRLTEIWQNLIENACKFMGDQKSPRIDIGMEQRDKETVFYVRDNGIGIEPRYHDRIFDLFEKLDKKIEGTGMGLAIVKRIVELYQGRIWVESAGTGQGTCFCFTLPGAIKTPGVTA